MSIVRPTPSNISPPVHRPAAEISSFVTRNLGKPPLDMPKFNMFDEASTHVPIMPPMPIVNKSVMPSRINKFDIISRESNKILATPPSNTSRVSSMSSVATKSSSGDQRRGEITSFFSSLTSKTAEQSEFEEFKRWKEAQKVSESVPPAPKIVVPSVNEHVVPSLSHVPEITHPTVTAPSLFPVPVTAPSLPHPVTAPSLFPVPEVRVEATPEKRPASLFRVQNTNSIVHPPSLSQSIHAPEIPIHNATRSLSEEILHTHQEQNAKKAPSLFNTRSQHSEPSIFRSSIPSVSSTTSSSKFNASIPKVSTRPIGVIGGDNTKGNEKEPRTLAPSLFAARKEQSSSDDKKEKQPYIKQRLEPQRKYAVAPMKTIDGQDVDWDAMDENDTAYYLNEYKTKYNILSRYNKKSGVSAPSDDMGLSNMVKSYNDDVHRINIQLSTSNWKIFVSLFYYGIEALMRGYFKMTMFKGFGKYQYHKMYLYQQSMIELGEMFTDTESVKTAPHWKILQTSITQALIFIVSGFIAKSIGFNSNEGILKLINKAYKPTQEARFDADGVPLPPSADVEDDKMDPLSCVAEMMSGNGENVKDILSKLMGGISVSDEPSESKATNQEEDDVLRNFKKGSDENVKSKPAATATPKKASAFTRRRSRPTTDTS